MARLITRRHTLMSLALLGAGGRAFAQAEQDPDPWPDLKHMFFNDASIEEDKSLVEFEAPPRAEDAALVPVSFSAKLPPDDTRRAVKLTLVIDQNPVPLAAAFTLGAKAGDTRISTRVRVNSYTNARVVAELSDGSLHMATRYIKASGGCSAPMVKSMDEEMAALGQMKFRILPPTPGGAQRGASHDPPPQQFRAADGSGDAALYAGALYREARGLSGARSRVLYGGRHLDLGGSELPLHLHTQRREDVSRRGGGYGRQKIRRRMACDPRRRVSEGRGGRRDRLSPAVSP